jgi:hypothetical protein
VDASACRRLGDLVEGRKSAFLFLEAAAVLVCVPDAERLPITEPPQAARPNRLTAVYLQCESRQFPRAWAPRPKQAPPHQPYTAHASGTIFWRLLGVSCGGGRAGATAPGFAALGSRRYSLARPSSSGVTGCENRLRAMYKTSATPSSGLAETPSGGCGKDGFFLRLSLNYRNNSAAVLLSCGVVRSLPASLMDGSAPCCRWSYRRGPRTPL